VVDGNGKPLLRVQEEGDGFSRGAYLFDSGGHSVAHIGATPSGGRVYVSTAGKPPAALMAADYKGSPVIELSDSGKAFMSMDKTAMTFYGQGGVPLAVFGSNNRAKGYLELDDGGGSRMVEAGSLDNHRGYVLASPWKPSTTPEGDPSVLKGGGKK